MFRTTFSKLKTFFYKWTHFLWLSGRVAKRSIRGTFTHTLTASKLSIIVWKSTITSFQFSPTSFEMSSRRFLRWHLPKTCIRESSSENFTMLKTREVFLVTIKSAIAKTISSPFKVSRAKKIKNTNYFFEQNCIFTSFEKHLFPVLLKTVQGLPLVMKKCDKEEKKRQKNQKLNKQKTEKNAKKRSGTFPMCLTAVWRLTAFLRPRGRLKPTLWI